MIENKDFTRNKCSMFTAIGEGTHYFYGYNMSILQEYKSLSKPTITFIYSGSNPISTGNYPKQTGQKNTFMSMLILFEVIYYYAFFLITNAGVCIPNLARSNLVLNIELQYFKGVGFRYIALICVHFRYFNGKY